jgi:hypothetical protein
MRFVRFGNHWFPFLQLAARWRCSVPIKATAVIQRESKTDPRTKNKDFYASVTLLDEAGEAYGLPRYLSNFQEVGNLLEREAGVSHEELQDRAGRYERGEEVRISLKLQDEEAVKLLGFTPKQDSKTESEAGN